MSTSAVTGASSTIQTPSATRSTQPATASRASRVLPAPPGPSSVTRRACSSSSPSWPISRSRPTKLVTGADRFGTPPRCLLALQHGHVRGLQLRAGRHAQLLGQQQPHALVGGQRVGLATGRRERRDQLRGEPLVQRMLRAQGLELSHQAVAVAEREIRRDTIRQRGQLEILQARRGGRREAVVDEVRERRPAPQGQRLAQQLALALGIGAGAGVGDETLEVIRVDLHVEPVAARRGRDQAAVAERAPQPRDERLQGVHLVGREVLLPQRVDEPAGAHRASRLEREAGQQRAQAAAADGDRAPVELHFQRPEHADDHEGTVAGDDEFASGLKS